MKFLIGSYLRIGLAIGALCMAGCATVSKSPVAVGPTETKALPLRGVYHKVHKGETLWRIAKTYRVSVDEIIRANRIPNAASIEENQLLLVPGADVIKDVMPQDSVGKDTDFAWPVRGRIVSYFEDRQGAYFNRGIDIRFSDDDFVKSSREGRVVFADHLAGYGYTVILDHADGFFTVYGHNDKILVGIEDYVFRGEKIAIPARDGGQALVHFEIRKGDGASNPLYYLP